MYPPLEFSTAVAGIAREKYAEWGLFQPDIPGSCLEQRYTDDASEFVDVGGARVHYRDEGPRDGPTLLALHGVYSSLHTWDGWVDALDDVRVVRLDLPGFGLTGPNEKREYSLSYYVDFLDAFCETLGLDEVTLAGNSLGGAIGWRFAVTHPERVQKLLLLDAGRQQLLPPEAEWVVSPGFDVVPRYVTPRATTRAILKDAYGDTDKLTRDTVRRYHDLLLRTGNRRAVIKLAQNATPAPFEPTAVSCPTLVQWGEEDDWLPPSLGEQFAEEIPDATLRTYPGVGHVPMEEAPVPTARDAAAFLD
ncbi:alpha/beta fold hydrolase [Salinibaculum rarum]|uniref:alpha/beta fold hydrolase n=1 Tax=Salinibaculum rarum TaxID=3058903 RepID=UPI00265DE7C0|nr:alpha/beta hydrolase [Salinibaculum sp. KK48]